MILSITLAILCLKYIYCFVLICSLLGKYVIFFCLSFLFFNFYFVKKV